MEGLRRYGGMRMARLRVFSSGRSTNNTSMLDIYRVLNTQCLRH